MSEKIITTQRTSKRYKLAGCLGSILILFGILVAVPGYMNEDLAGSNGMKIVGITMFAIGASSKIYARIGKWWNND